MRLIKPTDTFALIWYVTRIIGIGERPRWFTHGIITDIHSVKLPNKHLDTHCSLLEMIAKPVIASNYEQTKVNNRYPLI